jgi:hypothetical protein
LPRSRHCEKDEIETKLSRSVPQNFNDVRELLKFAVDMIKEGDRPDRGGQMMLAKILESLPGVFGNTREAARKEAAVEMRDWLDALLDIFHKPGDLRMLRDAMVAVRDAAP